LQTSSVAEVLEGLSEGDRVVVSDTSGLKAGAIVKPLVVEQVQLPTDNN
jgi:hypothetical protein